MAQQEMSEFESWLFRHGIRVSQKMINKLSAKFLDNVDVLRELKLMNGATEALSGLEFDIYEKAVFNAIMRKIIEVSESEGMKQTGPGSANINMSLKPQIVSIKDNKNGTVDLEMKLVKSEDNNHLKNSIRFEWAEDEKALDMGTNSGVIIEVDKTKLDSVQKISNVPVKSNAGIFQCVWRDFYVGNAQPFRLKVESWDINHKGSNIVVKDNIIEQTTSTKWYSIYGTVECKPPFTYHWKFRIKTYKAHFMFGVERVANNYSVCDTHIGGKGPTYYHRGGDTHFYPTAKTGDYGFKRINKNGGEIDMWLDLRKYELRFHANGQDVGYKIEHIAQESYRMATSLHAVGQRIELVEFDCT